jgi:uncharacterized protein (DUF302 family)
MEKTMRTFILSICLLAFGSVQAADQFVRKQSQYSVAETVQRIEAILDKAKPIRVLGKVDHEANARSVNLELKPTTLLIFGNPALGTQLMQENPEAGVDLPMKMLVWEDDEGKVWLSYTSPMVFAERHQLVKSQPVLKKMTGALNKISDKATGRTE